MGPGLLCSIYGFTWKAQEVCKTVFSIKRSVLQSLSYPPRLPCVFFLLSLSLEGLGQCRGHLYEGHWGCWSPVCDTLRGPWIWSWGQEDTERGRAGTGFPGRWAAQRVTGLCPGHLPNYCVRSACATGLSILRAWLRLILLTATAISITLMRETMLREVRTPAQGHPGSPRQSKDQSQFLQPQTLDPGPAFFFVT